MADPTIDVPVITDIELTFGTTKALPPYERGRRRDRYEDVAGTLFVKGSNPSDHGLKLKDGLDSEAVHRAIRAHLRSREVPYEHKMQGVGRMIKAWFEDAGAK